jgi:hypothetical protein
VNPSPPPTAPAAVRDALTELEWHSSGDPAELLAGLPGKPGGRKLQLFACACCRHVGDLLTGPLSRTAIEAAEHFAEGSAGHDELAAAVEEAAGAAYRSSFRYAVQHLAHANSPEGAARVAFWATHGVAMLAGNMAAWGAERAAQCRFLRCVFGNPFRPAPVVDPAWLSWQGGLVATLAGSIYDLRCFVEMPLLALALEQAGCADEDLLAHLRDPGEHVKGCWCLDLLLGKGG